MLTLEERERIAYINNSPDHALVVEAMDGDEEKAEEIKSLKEEAGRLDKLVSEANDETEAVEDKVEDLQNRLDQSEEVINELREQIQAAGIDLV